MRKVWGRALVLAVTVMAASAAQAAVVLTFEGVGNTASINDFYNGGTDNLGNSGPNLGVSFSGPTLGLVDFDAGGSGNFGNEPSPDTIMFFLDASSAILNIAGGFDTGFSFYYTSSTEADVNVWSGLNATGALLGTIHLTAQYQDGACAGDPTGNFCNFTASGVGFAGIARSIDFGGTANYTGYDDITFGSTTPGSGNPVPEPATWALMILGFGAAGASLRRRRSLAAT
jgi:hypothetical protein